MSDRYCVLIAGLQRHGKTYYTEQKAIDFARKGGVSVAYNVGSPKDFAKFIDVEIITPSNYFKKRKAADPKFKASHVPTEIEYFSVKGKIYHFKDFTALLSGKCVKIVGLNNKGNGLFLSENDMFFEAFYKYCYNCFLICDDFKRYTEGGFSANVLAVLSRRAHCGYLNERVTENNCGSNIALIYHGINECPKSTTTYISHIVMFKLSNPPKLIVDNDMLDAKLQDAYNFLLENPKFSRVEIDTIMMQSKKIPFTQNV